MEVVVEVVEVVEVVGKRQGWWWCRSTAGVMVGPDSGVRVALDS